MVPATSEDIVKEYKILLHELEQYNPELLTKARLLAITKIDTLEEPPMFQISETHFAKTWLLDPRAPKIEKPEIIRDTHSKLKKAYNI